MTNSGEDELEAYLAEQMRDPGFRKAYAEAVERERRGWMARANGSRPKDIERHIRLTGVHEEYARRRKARARRRKHG